MTTTYSIFDTNGIHSITIVDSVPTGDRPLLTDSEIFELVTWFQSKGVLSSAAPTVYVTRAQEHISP